MLAEQAFYCQPDSADGCYHPRSPRSSARRRLHVNLSGRLRYLRLASLVWKLPTYARIVWGLVRDPRVPLPLKGLLAAGLAYVVVPIDLVPDAVPILGQADDLTVLLLVLDLFIANAPREVREEQVQRARNGTAQLDRDLLRLRGLMGDRYDQIRDRLPEMLERYGDLRDSRAVKALLHDWRLRRLREADGAAAPLAAEPNPAAVVASRSGDHDANLN
jgi:uncharacterized membrane protein YkvA (DUF1232 family)